MASNLTGAEQAAIISALKDQTQNVDGGLKWVPFPASSLAEEYEVATARFRYFIGAEGEEMVTPKVRLEIWKVSDNEDMSNLLVQTIEAPLEVPTKLADLYRMVRKRALGLETLKDDILGDLQGL